MKKIMMIAAMMMLAVCASAQSDKSPVDAYFTTSEMPDMLKWCPAPPDTEPFGLQISKEETPEIYKVLREGTATCDSICTIPKRYYMRKRPFMRFNEPTLYPEDEPALRKNGSYPSGHTLLGWSSALLLSEINPDRADTLLARGYMYGDSRLIVGAHWQSDVNAARLAASAAYARLHTSERFLEQMRRARQEFRVKKGLATIIEMKAYQKEQKKRAKAK